MFQKLSYLEVEQYNYLIEEQSLLLCRHLDQLIPLYPLPLVRKVDRRPRRLCHPSERVLDGSDLARHSHKAEHSYQKLFTNRSICKGVLAVLLRAEQGNVDLFALWATSHCRLIKGIMIY